MEYKLFRIKKEYYKKNDYYLYLTLNKLNNMKGNNYSYGIGIYNSICSYFEDDIIKNYLNNKYEISNKGNIYYFEHKSIYFDIRKSHIIINANSNLASILSIFYIYDPYIFVCNFKTGQYFFLIDYFKTNCHKIY